METMKYTVNNQFQINTIHTLARSFAGSLALYLSLCVCRHVCKSINQVPSILRNDLVVICFCWYIVTRVCFICGATVLVGIQYFM